MKIAVKITPKEDKLEMAQNAGFVFVEIYTDKNLLSSESIRVLRNFDFEYAVHAPTKSFDKGVIDFCEKLDVKTIAIHLVNEIPELKKLVDYAKKFGINICVENLSGNKLPTAKEFFELKEKIPNIMMNIDIEHLIMINQFPNMISEINQSIGHCHITGYPPNHHSPPYENPEIVKRDVEELKKIGYQEFITAEMDLKYQNEEILKKTFKFMNEIVNQK